MQTHSRGRAETAVCSVITKLKPTKPVLCFNESQIAKNVCQFREGFPGKVNWAVKSNPAPEVISSVGHSGIDGFDVASKNEIKAVRSIFPNSEIHFNHPIKLGADIAFAFTQGCRVFAADHPAEIDKIASVLSADGADLNDIVVMIRFHIGNQGGNGVYDFGSKFGASAQDAHQLLKKCDSLNITGGLCFHPGSQTRQPYQYIKYIEEAMEIFDASDNNGTRTLSRLLNVGGGFPCYYPDEDIPSLNRFFRAIEGAITRPDVKLICEPGRAIVADSIWLLVQVMLKRNDGRVYINDGFYGSFMELKFVDFSPTLCVYRRDGTAYDTNCSNWADFELFGPTCDSIDRLPGKFHLPTDLRVGDYIAFQQMGAYTNATATNFNGMEVPRLVRVNNFIEDVMQAHPNKMNAEQSFEGSLT